MKCLHFISFLLICFQLAGQTKKQVRDYGIRSMTETHIEYNNGEEVRKFVKQKTIWDNNGNITLDEYYTKTGSLISRHTYIWKGKKLVEEKQEVNQRKKEGEPNEFKHYVYLYDGQRKIGRETFDKQGNLESKEVYNYNRFGDKIEEVVLNAKAEIITRTIFTYNSKGLRKERNKMDAGNITISRVIYEYTY